MKILFLCLIFLALISCKKETEDKVISAKARDNSELTSYLQTFDEKLQLAGIPKTTTGVKASFVDDLPTNIAGTCQAQTKTIKISRQLWSRFTQAGREQLMYHELGHCVLGRSHLDAFTADGRPASVMHSFHFWDNYYIDAYGAYMNELFQLDVPELAALEFNENDYASSLNSMALEQENHETGPVNCHFEME